MTKRLTRQLDAAFARAHAKAVLFGAEARRAIRVRRFDRDADCAVTWLLNRQGAYNAAMSRLGAARYPRPAEVTR